MSEWEAKIINQIEKGGLYLIELSETAFYPEGGGQPRDFGWIDGIEVVDLVEEDEKIYHVVKEKINKETVTCRIDFERRFDHMQNHTGQHLLSAVFLEMCNAPTNSFHLGDDYLTIDIGLENINDKIVLNVENRVNELIFKNILVKSYIVNLDEARKLPLRKLPPTNVDIRIVEIEGIDYSPCCGTHVKSLGEIGMLKILKTEKYKNMTRIYFKCGKRLLKDFQEKNIIINSLIKNLSVPQSEILLKFDSLQSEIKNLTRQLNSLKELNAEFIAKELLNESKKNKIVKIFEDKSFEEVQTIASKITSLRDDLVVLASLKDKKVVLAHNGSLDINCGKIFKEELPKFNGRGGGSPKFSQGSFETINDLNDFIAFLSR
ncbi:DHHA1 domain-containing protein [Caloramator sp. CAR-1]|uniref:alanyl-tRNA editing protein n=1 Tax=Caloramator sp. CAR-1 TaxID=3062777 RepID=UPI0026E1BD55|nr:DHHA1 domain-containing protein [Caloramator sp. CAR-1]MDO6355587.1 DHHA1 domain-containing protein [Caloramator sp. CAR-1]